MNIGVEVSASAVGPGPMGRFWQLSAEQLAPDLQDTFGITPAELTQFHTRVRSEHPTDPGLATVAAWGQRSTSDKE